jgi:hypothetical protein
MTAKAANGEANNLPPSSVDIKKDWSPASIQWVLTPVVYV